MSRRWALGAIGIVLFVFGVYAYALYGHLRWQSWAVLRTAGQTAAPILAVRGQSCVVGQWRCVGAAAPPPDDKRKLQFDGVAFAWRGGVLLPRAAVAWAAPTPNGHVWENRVLGAVARAQIRQVAVQWVLVSLFLLIPLGGLFAWGVRRRRRHVGDLLQLLARGRRDEAQARAGPWRYALDQALRELETAQRRLVATERVAALGYLAGGLAHQVGNPLAAARQYLTVAQQQADGGHAWLSRVDDQLMRVERAMEAVLRLAQPSRLAPAPLTLHPWLASLLQRVREQWGTDVVFALDVPAALTVETDALALEQVMMNVLRNAAEAQAGTGTVRVYGELADKTQTWCRLEVHDQGPGFPQGFDLDTPLASGKPHGTGLGLPLAARLVELLGGRMVLENARAGGAVVRIELPVAPAPASREVC